MTIGIYEITNLETNQKYVGQSIRIEERWKAHQKNPARKMEKTMELYKRNPKKVTFKIIHEISDEICEKFSKHELGFILDVAERKELIKRGGWRSKNTLNAQPIYINAVEPSILDKREFLPYFIEDSDLLEGIRAHYSGAIYYLENDVSRLKNELNRCEDELNHYKQSTLNHYHYESKIKLLKSENTALELENDRVSLENDRLSTSISDLKSENTALELENEQLKSYFENDKEIEKCLQNTEDKGFFAKINAKIKRWFV